MRDDQTHRFWRSAAQCLLGSIVLALVAGVAFRLQANAPTATLLFLFVIVVVSLRASLVPSLLVSIIAILCLDYLFTPPLFQISISETLDVVALAVFSTTSLIITRLTSTVRTSLQEVRVLKDQLRLVVDTIPALAWSARPDGARDFVSQRWLEYTGFSAKDALGWGWTAAVHPEDRARFVDEWKAALAAGEPLDAETRLRRADGDHRWFLIRAVPLRDELGQIAKWYGTATDIEDRKQAEAALVRSEERWKDVFENNPTMYFIVDASGTILSVNPFGADQLGYTVNELVGHSVLNVFHEADREAAQRNVATCLEQRGQAMSWEIRKVRKDGTVLWVRETAKAARWGESQPIVLVACEEITDRKQAEKALREQARLLDLTHDTIFVRDANDVITYWNRGAEELYGWKSEEAVGKVSHQLTQTIFPAPLEEINAELLRTGRWEGELVHAKRDGAQVVVTSRWSLQRDEQGLPAAILETNNDITERKRAEEAVRKVQGELAHVTRVMTMGEMAASIAHEVNQPLSGVVINGNACLRWLAGDSPNLDEARDAAQRIIRDGKRASDVVARIRALSRKSVIEKEPLDMNEAIREVVTLAQGEIRRNRVALRTTLARDLPPVLGDRVQLQQVVLNLIMNGIEAMSAIGDRPRELVIKTQREEVDKVCVAVQDSGIGLDARSMDQLFDAFYTTKRGGMGMGLSISRSIVENHGGRLWAGPNDGPGTTFQFTVSKCQ